MKDQSEYNVRAVERALFILECFDSENPERGVSEIAQAVGLHKATTHRIVTTLLNYGFLERADDDQRYRPGLKLASLGYQVIERMNVRQEALPYMNQLVEQWNESCDLSIFDQEQAFYVEVLHGSHALTISAAIGQRLPAHCTASGKVFLAHLHSKEIDNFLSRPLRVYTPNTITSPDKLRAELQTIRQQGYSYDDEEFEDGIRAIAAPIRNHRSEVIAAMSIPGPINRIIKDRIPDLVDSLLRVTQGVSQRMGWNI
jgi:IclR family KDG regulon transcriptional repressor